MCVLQGLAGADLRNKGGWEEEDTGRDVCLHPCQPKGDDDSSLPLAPLLTG